MENNINIAEQNFLIKVFNWMAIGLLSTGLVAWFVYNSTDLFNTVVNTNLVWILFGLELIIVFTLSSSIEKMSLMFATGLFFAFSILNGITLSVIFAVYTAGSIGITFFITAGMFGAMSIYGYTTKKDLSSMGSYLIMGVVGLVIAGIANIFIQSSALYWIQTFAGIVIFVGLTAYDVNKIKSMRTNHLSDDAESRVAIHGALSLYLDFINLFLYLLRIFGEEK